MWAAEEKIKGQQVKQVLAVLKALWALEVTDIVFLYPTASKPTPQGFSKSDIIHSRDPKRSTGSYGTKSGPLTNHAC